MATIAALAGLFLALFLAPLVLGSFVVVQRSSERGLQLWFGLLTALLALSLLAGVVGLVAELLGGS
jgi:hypothetical protein